MLFWIISYIVVVVCSYLFLKWCNSSVGINEAALVYLSMCSPILIIVYVVSALWNLLIFLMSWLVFGGLKLFDRKKPNARKDFGDAIKTQTIPQIDFTYDDEE